MRSKTARLGEALTGRFTEHHAFLLTQMLARVDAVTADIATVQARRRWPPSPRMSGRRPTTATAGPRRRVRRRGHRPVRPVGLAVVAAPVRSPGSTGPLSVFTGVWRRKSSFHDSHTASGSPRLRSLVLRRAAPIGPAVLAAGTAS